MDNKAILKSFEQELLEDGKATTTMASYTGDIQGFLKWLADKHNGCTTGTGHYPTFVETGK